MAKYKIMRMNTGYGEFLYTVNMIVGQDLIPARPLRYYKTKAAALKRQKTLEKK